MKRSLLLLGHMVMYYSFFQFIKLQYIMQSKFENSHIYGIPLKIKA